MFMQPQTKNTWLIGGGVLLAFVLLSSFTIAKKAKDQKSMGADKQPIPQPSPKSTPQPQQEKVITKDDLVKQSQQPMVCPEGFVRVVRGGVAGGLFYTCEPVGKKIPKPIQP